MPSTHRIGQEDYSLEHLWTNNKGDSVPMFVWTCPSSLTKPPNAMPHSTPKLFLSGQHGGNFPCLQIYRECVRPQQLKLKKQVEFWRCENWVGKYCVTCLELQIKCGSRCKPWPMSLTCVPYCTLGMSSY